MTEIIPKSITANRAAARLNIEWNNGRAVSYPFELLRNACPCAQCRGGHENMKPEPDPGVFIIPLMSANATRLVGIEAVGNYAINVEWEDGHKYGIYNWHYLLALADEMEKQAAQGGH
ncbi:MAG: DUF971 domain-containing protein [Anaerolineales bacterium]|nr:DUF971 domain-containing protein [Anaerolineales bacterium]MCW5888846.1 DUF971 domain-containing protein [Anaerolineales bacterium]